jgi:pimeloyl-ACP methyl ester carboxylesterase
MNRKLVVFAACLALAAFAQERPAFFDPMVDIGTHRLQVHSEGTGSPVIVIDPGIGDTLDKLRPLQAALSRVTRVVTYNRAGYGRSEAGPLPRDCGREAGELRALLDKASMPGPYVLVGHSLGALNVQAFAAMYPDAVAGMALLDPPPLSFLLGREYRDLEDLAEHMTTTWQAMADAAAMSADDRERAQGVFYRMIASEHREMFGASAKRVAGMPACGNLPLLVMAAGKPNPAFGAGAAEYQKYWVAQSRALAAKSAKGRFVLAKGSSHYLYLDDPALVAESIIALVSEVRAK